MYACSNCGGNLKFDIRTQKLGCEYCQAQMDVYSFEDKDPATEKQTEFDATIFSCPQCGGEIVSTDTSAAEFCTFCGASTILHSRLTKEKRPNYIIPFQKTKEDCKQAYTEMMKKAIFAPDALKNPKYIDGFRGIYMPYWAFHLAQEGSFSLKGTKSKRRGDYIITDHYALTGEIDAYYKGLSYDASSSFDDNISGKIAPYDVKGMKEFTPAFLSGFYADTADVAPEKYLPDAESIAIQNSTNAIYGEFSGVNLDSTLSPSVLNTQVKEIDSAMFPVWFMSYRNAGRVAYATINGQTGKVVTDLPVDTKKYTTGSFLLALPIFLILNLLFTITPFALLIITAILAAISLIVYSSEVATIKQKEEIQTKKSVFVGTISAIIICVAIAILQPVSDIFYYGAAILSLSAVFYSFKDIIGYYNIMSTRRLPQFDRTGGDDRA